MLESLSHLLLFCYCYIRAIYFFAVMLIIIVILAFFRLVVYMFFAPNYVVLRKRIINL